MPVLVVLITMFIVIRYLSVTYLFSYRGEFACKGSSSSGVALPLGGASIMVSENPDALAFLSVLNFTGPEKYWILFLVN